MTALKPLAAIAPLGPIAKLVVPAGPGLPTAEQAKAAIALAERIRAEARTALITASASGLEATLDAIDNIAGGTIAGFEAEMKRLLAARADYRAEMDGAQCRRGCAFCCHVDVVATPFEAIRIATSMRRGQIPDRRAAVAEAALPSQARGARNTPCPLLVEGACSAYAIRPFACRSLFSSDAKLCELGFAAGAAPGAAVNVPSLSWPRLLSMGYLTGLVAAMRDLGLAARLIELRAALALLLADESAASRWLQGDDVFPRQSG